MIQSAIPEGEIGLRFCQLGHGTAETRAVCVLAGVRYVGRLLLCQGCAEAAEKRKGTRAAGAR